jgi:hypothetical protein
MLAAQVGDTQWYKMWAPRQNRCPLQDVRALAKPLFDRVMVIAMSDPIREPSPETARPHHPAIEAPTPPPSQATFGQTLSAVFWSFFGVRKGGDMRRDAVSVNPVVLILTGIGMAALLVVGLLLLVRAIVS